MRGVLTRWALPFLLFVLLGLAISFPLVLHLSDRLPGQVAGDNLSFLWNLWWMRQSGTGFFWTPMLFAPFGIDLALHTHTALQAAIAATLLRGADVVTAQNLIILATLAANGWTAYLLARDRTGDTIGALVAGVMFATATYVSVHLLGHFSLIGIWTLPLFLLCALRAIERRSVGWSLCCGVSLVACAYTDYYYTVYCLAVAVGLVVADTKIATLRLRPTPLSPRARIAAGTLLAIIGTATVAVAVSGGIDRTVLGVRVRATEVTNLLSAAWIVAAVTTWRRLRPRLDWHAAAESMALAAARVRSLIPAALVALLGVIPVLLHARRMWAVGDSSAPPHLWRSGPGGIDLATLVLGSPLHPVTGAWTTSMYRSLGIDPIEGVGWLGIVPILALLWGVARARTNPQVRRFVAGGVLFFVWALGPWLRVGGVNTGLILPENFFGLVPVLSNARMPGRALVVTLLAAALLAARYIAQAPPRRKVALAIAAGALMCVDSIAVPFPLIAMQRPPELYFTLASMPGGSVCELPMGLRDGFGEVGAFDDRTLQYQMTHGHPLAGGFAARIPGSIRNGYADLPVVRSLLRLSDPAQHDPDPRDAALTRDEAVQRLEDADIRFIVLDRSRASRELVSFVDTLIPARSIRRDGDRELLEIGE